MMAKSTALLTEMSLITDCSDSKEKKRKKIYNMSKQWGSLDIKPNMGLVGAGKLKAAEAPKPAQLNKCLDCPALVKKNKIRCSPCQYDHLVANRHKYNPITRQHQKEKAKRLTK